FTELKIDQSFVGGVCEDPTARAMLESSISLANKLDMYTVAEGVETEAELAMVEELGCDQIQGYYIAKPMFANEFEQFIQSVSMAQDQTE
ncbi:MAG: EAL domain-containing protein, partial [Gammaproteobacteria bacterium]|nr:EAL domain-containing protein [Gammaproteobacteria bacterium]